MAETHNGSGEPMPQIQFEAALINVGLVLSTLEGEDIARGLAEIAGGGDTYNALIAGSESFLSRFPRVYEGRGPAPEVTALWVGLIAGVRAAKNR
jgi:hypothetical protein